MKKLKRLSTNLCKLLLLATIITQTSYSFELWDKITRKTKKPSWVSERTVRNNDFNFYGIGSAKKHINGKAEQEKLALSRAVEELTAQKNTQVNSTVQLYQQNTNVNLYQESQFTINENISFKIIDTWTDNTTGEIFYLVGCN